MKIWYGSILVATVVLAIYMVIVADKYIPALYRNVAESKETIKLLQEQLNKQNVMLEALQTDIKAMGKDKKPAGPSPEEIRKTAVESLRSTLAKFTEADAQLKQGDVNNAVDILKSTKQSIWKSGDVFTSEQSALRALMAPIDVIIDQWKKGDKAADTSKVLTAVKTILQKLDSQS